MGEGGGQDRFTCLMAFEYIESDIFRGLFFVELQLMSSL